MTIKDAPCEAWPVDLACCDLPPDTTQEVIDRWALVASTHLWLASGRRYGPSCPVTVRPCRRSCADVWGPLLPRWGSGWQGSWFVPYKDSGGIWRNATPCGCATDCSCTELCEIRLEGPVYDVVSVQDGAVLLPPEAYRVDDGSLLVRTDGGCWPDCQDMAADVGEPDTLAVTYRTGLALDPLALVAVSELTCHYIRGCSGSCGCGSNAPRNLRTLNRQGVTLDMADPLLMSETGLTGIRAVDDWVRLVNPHRLAAPGRVYSPDLRRGRITTWP